MKRKSPKIAVPPRQLWPSIQFDPVTGYLHLLPAQSPDNKKMPKNRTALALREDGGLWIGFKGRWKRVVTE